MLMKVGVGFLAVFLGLSSAITLAVLQGGVALVHVQEEDLNVTIPLPLALVDIALNFVPRGELTRLRNDLAPVWKVAVEVLGQLAKCPDAVLVEVEDADDTVVVSIGDGELMVDVQTPHEKVHISVPVQALARIIHKLSAAAA